MKQFSWIRLMVFSVLFALRALDNRQSFSQDENRWNEYVDKCHLSQNSVEFELVYNHLDTEYKRGIFSRNDSRTLGVLIRPVGRIAWMISGNTVCGPKKVPMCRDHMRLVVQFMPEVFEISVEPVQGKADTSPMLTVDPAATAKYCFDKYPDTRPISEPRLRTVKLVNEKKGSTVSIQLRTPTDAERFGHHLQSMSGVVGDHAEGTGIRAICHNPQYFTFKYQNPEALHEWPKGDGAQGEYPDGSLWNFICPSYSHVTNPETYHIGLQRITDIIVRMHLEFGAESKLGAQESIQLVSELDALLREACRRSSHIGNSDPSVIIEDPVMRCRFSEEFLTPIGSWRLIYLTLPQVMSTASVTLDSRSSLCDCVGDLGCPAFYDFSFIKSFPDADFMEAILFSRWEVDWTSRHLAACLQVLSSVSQTDISAFVAVETLVRVDELDNIPQENLMAWWSEHGTRLQHPEFHTTLTILSRQPTGRKFLLTRLGSKDRPEIQTAIWKNLKLRAESTVRTRRWDFMTEAECEQILALPSPPTPGKDTEGGPARPFPTDE